MPSTTLPAPFSSSSSSNVCQDEAGPRLCFPAPLLSDYEPVQLLGKGGMGAVWLARRLLDRRLCAVKVPTLSPDGQGQLLERFRREVRALRRLNHPHIVRINRWGEPAGCPFYEMPYLQGGNLRQRCDRRPADSPRAIVEAIFLLAQAVQHLHDRGMLHRDIKPANILFTEDSDSPLNPLLADFGLVRNPSEEVDLTGPGPQPRTPAYSAPEQASPYLGTVRQQADHWGLGFVTYEWLTGQRPQTLLPTLRPTPRELCRDIPASLEAVCVRCLRFCPDDRYRNTAELVDALRRCRNDWPD